MSKPKALKDLPCAVCLAKENNTKETVSGPSFQGHLEVFHLSLATDTSSIENHAQGHAEAPIN